MKIWCLVLIAKESSVKVIHIYILTYCNKTLEAGERHIPKCKDTINRPKPPPTILA
mgnify:CR=1 FL=1